MLNLEPKKEIFIPEKCKACNYYIKHEVEVLGIRVQTPFSYILVKGCVSDIPCEEKNVQTLFFGLSSTVETDLRGELWGMLSGDERLNDKEKLIETIEIISGYRLKNLKKVQNNIPSIVERFIETIIASELPCGFEYPLTGWGNSTLEIHPVFEEFTVLRRPLPASPEQMFGIYIQYIIRRSGVMKTFRYVFDNDKVELYWAFSLFTDGDSTELLSKIDFYLEKLFTLLIENKAAKKSKLIKIGKLITRYIKHYSVFLAKQDKEWNKIKEGEQPPLKNS